MIVVETFRVDECSESDLDAWCRLFSEEQAYSSGGTAGAAALAKRLRAETESGVHRWVVRAAGRIHAVAELLPQPHDPAVGFLRLFVAAAIRRKGIGSRLLARVAADAKVRRIQATVLTGTPGESFVREWRVLLRLELHEQRLDHHVLRRCHDLAMAPHPGYQVRLWRGAAPAELVASFGRVMGHVLDAPDAAMQMAPRNWDTTAVRAWEADMDGQHLLVCAAVHTLSGEVVAATVTTVPKVTAPKRTGPVADQHDTAVAPGHRGHGLAHWIKAHQTLRLHKLFPQVEALTVTVNSANTPMLAVNRALGYRLVHHRLLVERPARQTPR